MEDLVKNGTNQSFELYASALCFLTTLWVLARAAFTD